MNSFKLSTVLCLFFLWSCTPKFVKTYQSSLVENASSQKDIDRNIILKYAIENKLELQSTASGIYYSLEKPGDDNHPNMDSEIKAHYTGTLMNGEKFDSSYDRDSPLEFQLRQVIKGWAESIPLLGKGGKGKFFIPSGLAYGKKAIGPIPANSVLVFDIELLDFR